MQTLILSLPLVLLAATAVGQVPGKSLRGVFEPHFGVGVALGSEALDAPEQGVLDFVPTQFGAVTPENALKWERVHPEPDRYEFSHVDRLLDYCEQHGLALHGHVLVWHSQTPDWVFQNERGGPATRDELLRRMRDHIQRVAGRFRGRIATWDVVNEALNEDGTLRDSPWRRIIGDDYLEHAFRFAAEAAPDALLLYNDYGLHRPAKRGGAIGIVKRLKRAGCRVDGVGMQGHWSLHHPSEQEIEESILAYANAAGRVFITELDVNVLPFPEGEISAEVSRRAIGSPEMDPYAGGLPTDVQRELADRYAGFFRLFLRHSDVIDRVTFWGVDDGRSWHNGWPIPGRTAHSLLFDRQLRPKPAYHAVIDTAATNP